ncbi:hypothetical protein BGX27_003470 [Mortierella sp. AM989]|nr:hypothetical protein BGX27_003470 [Mortierella sp. AM989]
MLTDLSYGHIYWPQPWTHSTLIQMYNASNENNDYRQAVLRYITEWEIEGFEEFFQDLVLGRDDFRWVSSFPKPSTNPIRFGIITARENPLRGIRFHRTLIKHCFRNALREGDTLFLKPIFGCMSLILEDRHLGLEVTRQIAFIPVLESCRDYIIENSATGQSLSPLKIPFFGKKHIALHKLDNPTLRLRVPQALDQENKYFKKRLFVAPLAMLYDISLRDNVDESPEKYDVGWRALVNNSLFESRAFPSEFFHNPALEALIQHEWNLGGSQFWIVRALAHALTFYLIMALQFIPGGLGVSLVGIDPPNQPDKESWESHRLFLKIIAASIVVIDSAFTAYYMILDIFFTKHVKRKTFFSQKNRFWLRGLSNVALIWTTAAGLILESVQLLALANLICHFKVIYKLRVNQNFCRFLDFFSRLAREIGLFLSLFTFGVVVFAQIFWFLAHGCMGYNCKITDTRFPSNFFEAIFVTYFFLSGQYDSVEIELDGTISMFHLVMSIYYFFTAIIMVNVLIGVALGKSIEAGDSTWRLTLLSSRLQYIILRARNARNRKLRFAGNLELLYARETYFTATEEDVIAFHQKHAQDSEDFLQDRKIVNRSLADNQAKDTQIEELKTQVEDMMAMMKQVLQERKISDSSASQSSSWNGPREE